MRTYAVSLLLGLFATSIGAESALAAGNVKWATSWDAASKQAKERNTIIMIDFYADWCGWCKQLDKKTFADARVVEQLNRLVPLKIDGDNDRAMVARYNVSGYPNIVFVDASGKVVHRIDGYLDPQPFLQQVSALLDSYTALPALEAEYKKNPSNTHAAAQLAVAYAVRGDATKARKLIESVEARDPSNAPTLLTDAYMAMGNAYVESDKPGQSIKWYEKIINTCPDRARVVDARLNVAYAYIVEGQGLPAGSRARAGKAKKAADELTAILQLPDLPDERKQQAEQMLQHARSQMG